MSKTRIIIARHGNTFDPDEAPRRVGARTDLDLVEMGIVQATQLGTWLKEQDMIPARIIAGPLKRTTKMAEIARTVIFEDNPKRPHIEVDERLREIDYGPDEDLREEEVINRIGADAIALWDQEAVVPDGWNVNPEQLKKDWQDIAENVQAENDGKCVLIVTSNGIARFAPFLTGNFKEFAQDHSIKLSTGALGILEYDDGQWRITEWNLKPKNELN